MKLSKGFVSLLSMAIIVNAQRQDLKEHFSTDILKSISSGEQQFGLELLNYCSAAAEASNRDFMISPYSIWSLLLLMLEGSSGKTYQQLRATLRINVDDAVLRSVFHVWSSKLNVKTVTIEVASLQALYTDKSITIAPPYTEIIANYGAQQISVDFKHRDTFKQINEETNKATRGLIKHTVRPQDIAHAKIFILSSLFFKGQWTYPFNVTFTRTEPFYNEAGEIVSHVPMMIQENNFAYSTTIIGLDGYVLELPYGQMDRLSMIIVLPKRGFKLHHVVGNLNKIGLKPLFQKLAANKQSVLDNVVEVVIPKFTTETDLVLNELLNEMGITDLFNQETADLSRMARGLFVNLCIHTTKIIVDEEGTTAGAVSSAVLINKTTPPKFILNKPFLYMIVDTSTNLLLFAGQVRNPK